MKLRKKYHKKKQTNQKSRWQPAVLAAGAVILISAVGITGWKMAGDKKQAEQEALAWRSSNVSEDGTALKENEILYQGKKYKRNSYMKAILMIGVDQKGEMEEEVAGSGGQADGLFLVAHDTARDSAKVLMIPRDTMTEITLTDLSGNVLGKDVQHLTLAYAYGDGKEQSCEYLAEAVSELLNDLHIDHYMSVNLSALPILNDAVGGVPVTIETDELEQFDEQLKQGSTVTLNGEQAELFVRYRDINVSQSALSRMDRQKQYMENYVKTMQKQAAEDEQLLSDLLDTLQPYMVTDMAKDQYLGMAVDLLGNGDLLSEEDILVLPGEGKETDLYDEYYVDQEAMVPMILDLFYREAE